MTDVAELGRRAHEMLDALAACTDEPGRITRLSFGPAHERAAGLVRGWMADAGLEARVDAVGTVRGRATVGPGRTPGAGDARPRRLLVGSHIDTVPDAGGFDGMLGVVVGILAAGELRRRGEQLPFELEVLAFGDEEGLRFPGASIGSLALAQALPQSRLAVRDATGVTLGEALAGFGLDPAPDLRELVLDPAELVGYLEVHIEQGPVLEASGEPLGLVTSIAAATRLRVTVIGRGGHAGTVPMSMRADALAAAADLVLAVEAVARSAGTGVVATVGELDLASPAANAIPERVTFTIDLRAPLDGALGRAREHLADELRAAADRRGVSLELVTEYEGRATVCDEALSDAFAAAAAAEASAHLPRLTSGAGHDAQSLAAITPVAMLFVRCRDGVSHVPQEYASPEDVGLAVTVLADTIAHLARTTAAAAR